MLRVVSLFLVLVAASASAQFRTGNHNRDYLTWYGLSKAALSSFAASSGNLPQATHLCAVGVATGSNQWECTTMAVTQPPSPVVEGTWLGWGSRKTIRVTGATSSPTVPAATAAAAGLASLYTGDHWVAVAGYAGGTAFDKVFSHGVESASGLFIDVGTSGEFRCRWSNAGSVVATPTVTIGKSERFVGVCSKEGTTYRAWVNGIEGTPVVSASNPVAPTGRDVRFGLYDTGIAPLTGTLDFWAAGSGARPDPALMAACWWGFWGEGSAGTWAGTTTRATSRGCMGDDGYFYMVGDNAPCVTSKGVDSAQAHANYILNGLDYGAGSWTRRGAVSVSANADSGPFSRYVGGPEADLITSVGAVAVDDIYTLAAAMGGATTGTPLAVSIWLKKSSASGTLRIANAQGEAKGNWTVNLAALGSGYEKLTATHPAVTVGAPFICHATGNCGGLIFYAVSGGPLSFYLSNSQQEASAFPGPPLPCGGVACTANADVHTVPTTGWPTTSGEVVLAYTPNSTTGTRYLLDSLSSSTGPGLLVYVNTSGTIAAETWGGGAASSATYAGLPWTAGNTYCIRFRWGPGGLTLSRADATVASGQISCGSYTSGVTGAGTNLPTAHDGNAELGSNRLGANQSNGPVKLLAPTLGSGT